MANSGPKR